MIEPVFGVSNKARPKSVSSATETSKKIEISPVASLVMIFSKKRITKALISFCGCAGLSAPLLFANPEDRFSCVCVCGGGGGGICSLDRTILNLIRLCAQIVFFLDSILS